jgi:hypothetical protein
MTFVRGGQKPANSGRRKGTPNRGTERERRLIAEGDDQQIVSKVVAEAKAGDPGARQIYFRYLRPGPPRPASFAPAPFAYMKPTTMAEANAEMNRIAEAVAGGELDLDTGQFLVGAVRAVVETLTGVKIEKEIAAADALKPGSGP